ncbi:MAG: hypothetical protein ACLTK8_02675 [Paeniclostridium sp.]
MQNYKQITELKGELEDTTSLEQLKKHLILWMKICSKPSGAKVISKNDGLWYTNIVMSAGSEDGVKKTA